MAGKKKEKTIRLGNFEKGKLNETYVQKDRNLKIKKTAS